MKRVPDDLECYFKLHPHGDGKTFHLSLSYKEPSSATVLTKQSEPWPIDWANYENMRDSGYMRTKDEHLEDLRKTHAASFKADIVRWLKGERKGLDVRGPEGGEELILVRYDAAEA